MIIQLKPKRRVDYFQKLYIDLNTRIHFYNLEFIEGTKLKLSASHISLGDLEHISASIFLSTNTYKTAKLQAERFDYFSKYCYWTKLE